MTDSFIPGQLQDPVRRRCFREKMDALPAKLEQMATYVRLECQLPEEQQVSLIRLDTMLSFFLGEARKRQLMRRLDAQVGTVGS